MNFADFWMCYPKKEAKKAAEKAWSKLSMFDQQLAFDMLSAHIQNWADTKRQFVPHAATWLNGRRFDDEMPNRHVSASSDWWTECKTIHGSTEDGLPKCGNAWFHAAQMSKVIA